MSLEQTMNFFEKLDKNNNQEWFHDNQDIYQDARESFLAFLEDLLVAFQQVDENIPMLRPRDIIHRINRDMRFNKDKPPYHTQFSAVIGPDGKNSRSRMYYLAIGPEQSVAASGAHALNRDRLAIVREAIDEDAQPLRDIIEAESFQKYFELTGAQLKTSPRDYPNYHPDVDLLRYKEFVAMHHFEDDEVTSANFVDTVVEVYQAVRPLTDYFDKLFTSK